jgi:hypothetical protein
MDFGFGFADAYPTVFQDSVKRKAVGIWNCSGCKKVIAGGAWTVSTTAAATVRRCVCLSLLYMMNADQGPSLLTSTIRRLRDLTEA